MEGFNMEGEEEMDQMDDESEEGSDDE